VEDKLFLAWAAGFFDGEGSVGVYISPMKACSHGFRTVLNASLCQTSLPCLELVKERFGGSICTTEHRTPHGRRWAVQHKWIVRNDKAIVFLKAIQPYSVVKKHQIDKAITYPVYSPDGRKYGNASNPIPNEVMERRVALCAELKALKSEGKVMAKPARSSHHAK